MTDKPIRPPLPLAKSPLLLPDGVIAVNERGEVQGQAIRQCTPYIHVFAERPGACQCGEHYWDWEP